MHYTPGGPLRFSLEGHQFAVFGFRLTSDMRHLVSISNKIITFDLTTGDTSRTVYPSMVGLMLELDMCPNNKYVGAITFSSNMILSVLRYVLAFTNNNQTILLDSLTGQFQILANPFPSETIQVQATDSQFWKILLLPSGHLHVGNPICGVQPDSLEDVRPGLQRD